MKIKITQIIDSHTGNTNIIVNQGIGIQGKDAEFPQGGNIGDVLVKTENSQSWTNEPTEIKLNGGNF